jgi:hypothetical protein
MITVQVESFKACLTELTLIFQRHWQEYALFQDRMPLAPQYDEYVRRDEAGELVLVTARRDGVMVAYYTAAIRPGFHYKDTLTATQDLMYVVAEEPWKGVCRPLLECVEDELKRRGVKIWYAGYKSHRPQGMPRLFGLFGFEPADVYVTKWIGNKR